MSQAQPCPDNYSPAPYGPEPFIPRPAARSRPARLAGDERKLPYRMAMPLIAGLSLGLWVIIWQIFSLASRFVLS
jgi:hypothetical protein